MSASGCCHLLGRWRILEAGPCDNGRPDLRGPATITIGTGNRGDTAFGALQATLDLGHSSPMVFFTWAGCDAMNEVTGEGHPELLDDGSIEITFACHNGDEAILGAERDSSSTAWLERKKPMLKAAARPPSWPPFLAEIDAKEPRNSSIQIRFFKYLYCHRSFHAWNMRIHQIR